MIRDGASSFALFHEEGGHLHANPGVRSPWTPNALSGTAVSALIATLAEQVPVPYPALCARMSLELLRPVPDVPLRWTSEIVREGRKMQVLRLSLLDEERVCATATLVRLRMLSPAGSGTPASEFTPPPGEPFAPSIQGRSGSFLEHLDGRLEPRQDLAHRRGWLRFNGQVIAGTPLSPFAHAALYADFGNGMAAGVDARRYTFTNAELTLHLARLPAGNWLHLDCHTIDGGVGLGTTRILFSDPAGTLGYAHQSLLYEPRE